MATGPGGPPPWDEAPPSGRDVSRRIAGSYPRATLPAFMDSEGTYGDLHVLRIQGLDKKPLPNAPFMIRKSIQAFLGAKIEGAYPESNRSSYALKVRNIRHFDTLLKMTQLSDGTPVEVIEHPALNTTRCVVNCRDVIDITEQEIVEELKDQGVREVRRITRKSGETRVKTPTLIVSVRGTCQPEFLDFGYIRCRTRPYYPSPMQCFHCWAFGHTRPRCRAVKGICGNCSGDHPILADQPCPEGKYCSKCDSTQHAIRDRSCPAYKKENDIQRIKVDRDVPYPEARRIYEQGNGPKTYANVTAQNNNELANLNRKIDELTEMLTVRDRRIEQLEAALQGQTLSSNGTISSPDVIPPSFQAMLDKQEAMFNRVIKNLVATNIQMQKEVQQLKHTINTSTPIIDQTKQRQEPVNDTCVSNNNLPREESLIEFATPVEDPLSKTITPEKLQPTEDPLDIDDESHSPDNSPNPTHLAPAIGTPRPASSEVGAIPKATSAHNHLITPKRPYNTANSPEKHHENSNAPKVQRKLPITRNSGGKNLK